MDGRNGGGGGYPQPAPAGKGGGLAIPGMGNRQEAERQRNAPPPAAPPSVGLAIPGMPSRSTPSEGPGLAIPGMPSRSTPSEGPGLAIPGMANRSGAGPLLPGTGDVPSEKGRILKVPEVSVKVAYVTDTVTTPSNRGKKRGGPVKLSSMEPDGGLIVAHQDSEASNRRTSGRSLMGVATASQNSLPRWASSTGPRPYQSTASLQSDGFANSSFLSWAPQQFVQSWHQKLSQKYRDYNMVNMVGEGRHGAVFIVQHKHSEEYYACKLLNKLDNEVQSMRTEIETMRRLDHPNVVRLFETLEDAENVFLLMELCHGGDLFNRITSEKEGRLVEDVARTFSEQMLSALAYCHGKGIVHRDVKPENFLLYTDDPTCEMLKLADFGIATSIRPVHVNLGSRSTSMGDFEQSMPIDRVASSTASFALSELQNRRRSFHSGGSEEFCGSLPYMAPELLSRQARGGRKGVEQAPAVDVWSTGIVIYVMLSGDLPYGADPELICSDQKPPFESEVWRGPRGVSQPAKDLILKLVNHSVDQRWTAKQGLRHEWLLAGLPPVEGNSFSSPDSKRDLAIRVLHHLRRWSQMSKLQRIAIGAIAKRLDAQHPAQKLAEQVYRTFGDASESLQCDRLVEAMSAVLCDGESQSIGPPVEKTRSGSENSGLSSPSESSYSSFGGFRQRMLGPQIAMKNSLRKVKESISGIGAQRGSQARASGDGRYVNGESGTPTEKRGSTQESLALDVTVTPSELRSLVRMLDSTKTGTVIYTLLVAAFLPADAFSDDRKIKEVFDMLDVRKKDGIGAEDLARALGKHRDSDVKKLALSIAEFDRNNDGVLDFKEFRQMVRGDAVVADPAAPPPPHPSSSAAASENPAPRKSTIRHL